MKPWYLFVCFIAISTGSCRHGKPARNTPVTQSNSLGYKYIVYKEQAADCGDRDTTCTHVEFIYPVFINYKILNDSIVRKLCMTSTLAGKPDSSLDTLAKHFIADYKKIKQKEKEYPLFFTLKGQARVLKMDSLLINVQIDTHTYSGGGHSYSYTYFINWDAVNNKLLSLQDLVKNDCEDKFVAMANAFFDETEKIEQKSNIQSKNFFISNKFHLNNNFLITTAGIKIFYNEYEMQTTISGATGFIVPWSKIKHLLRPNAVITQYLK
jgi:hypothetical protein